MAFPVELGNEWEKLFFIIHEPNLLFEPILKSPERLKDLLGALLHFQITSTFESRRGFVDCCMLDFPEKASKH